MNKFKEQFEYIRKQQTILDTRILMVMNILKIK